jgi:hypothetical protein
MEFNLENEPFSSGGRPAIHRFGGATPSLYGLQLLAGDVIEIPERDQK